MPSPGIWTAAIRSGVTGDAGGPSLGGGRWLVNGSGKGLVALTIEPPVEAKVWIKSVTLRSLWVSVTDPDALVAACMGAGA